MTRLRYSERPADWRNLTASSWGAIALLACLGAWRGRWPWWVAAVGAGLGVAVAIVAWARPRWFRGWYRAVRWTGHQMGRVTGAILLTAAFVVVTWPLGCCLRLMGRRPLHEKPGGANGSYWRPATQPGPMDRMF